MGNTLGDAQPGRPDWRPAVGLLLAAVTLFTLAPLTDLTVSGWLYSLDEGFLYARHPVVVFVYETAELAFAMLLALCLLLVMPWGEKNAARQRRQCAAGFILCCAVVGPGLVVNGVFKENWGRARPVSVEEFGGQRQYTPPLVPASQCTRNCSFVSGHASIGFGLMALAIVWPRRRRAWILSGIAAGSLIGLGRMLQGKHFLSDIVFCGLLMWFSIVLVDRCMHSAPSHRTAADRWLGPLPRPSLVRGSLSLRRLFSSNSPSDAR